MERWYADNQVYFLTARCFGKYRAFATEDACAVFWDRLEHYAKKAGFKGAMKSFNATRPLVAVMAVGIGRAAW